VILKGNIRTGGQELARHLLNDQQEIDPFASRQSPTIGNEKVEVAELRGFAADDLHGAFREAEAIAAGTRSTKPLYSLSINPSKELSRDDYAHAIGKIEKKLGLEGQARAVVFHQKHGREHCHVVWSRIDLETMKTRHNAYDRQKLREVARELVRDFGHEMPKHLGEDRGADRHKDKFNAQTLAGQAQQARTGLDPAERKAAITEAYRAADSLPAFRHALAEKGFVVAKGDRAAFVVVDQGGEAHSLNRQIDGAKAKEIEAKLSLKQARDLPTVQQAKEIHAREHRQTAEIATQERPDSPDRVEIAQKALTALREAQAAELKAMRGAQADRLDAIRKAEADRQHDTKREIKEAFRPDWADLYKRQRAEMEAIQHRTATMGARLKTVLTRQTDPFDFANRGTLAGAFNFVVRGQIDTAKLEKAHAQQRRELGDTQRLAERTEARAIKQEVTAQRKEAREDHRDELLTLRNAHAAEVEKAVKALEIAQKINERDGRDLSRGEVDDRATGFEGRGFGFGKQGFERDSAWGGGFGGLSREDDDDERQIKPPGMDFNP
jgi:hypothetical protein